MSDLIQAIVELKLFAMKHVTTRPATFHGVDLLLKIAGWEEASRLGDTSFELDKKIQHILEEELSIVRGY